MSKIIESLNWRYATKKYDKTKKLTEEQISLILNSANLAPTSYGLQPFRIFNIKDLELREKLKSASYGQTQVTDASHFLVFAVPKKLDASYVQRYMECIKEVRGVDDESLKGFSDMINNFISSRNDEQNAIWSMKQAYLALGFILETSALENIDATPMEGFDPNQFDQILGFEDLNMKSVVAVALGFRSQDDEFINYKKVRLPIDTLVVEK